MQAFTGKYKRTNIVFDVHLLSSLKSETGSMREMGVIATKMLKWLTYITSVTNVTKKEFTL